MNEKNPNHPQEQSSYQTGRTRPPKSFGGLIAVLLVCIILLGGIASALGILNVRLFRSMSDRDTASNQVQFSQQTPESQQQTQDNTQQENSSGSSDDISIQINQSPLSVDNVPQDGGLSLQEIYNKAIGCVVSIACQAPSGDSTGTGVIISRDGYVITNSHVVENATAVSVLLSTGETLAAQPVGSDAVSDLAVLHVDRQDLTPAEFGDSSSLRVGDTVVAIGDPLGIELRGTMTNGIVSAINRDITTGGRTMTLIQTNAALNAGNSGGPLLNCYGQVIGINTMKIGDYMNAAGVEGLGFAIPSTTVKEVVDQLISQGYVSGRPTLGLTTETVSTFIQLFYHMPQGVYITNVQSGSDAAAKGLTPGDILLALDNQPVPDSETLTTLLYNYNAGDTVQLLLYRSGKQFQVEVTLGQSTG